MTNPFAGRRPGTTDIAQFLHPEGKYLATITDARIYNARTTGRETLELQIRTDWHVEHGQEDRRVFRHFVFDGDGAVFTEEFMNSLNIDLSEAGSDDWREALTDAVIGRRIEVFIYHTVLAGRTRAQTRYALATDQTRAQDRILAATDEDGTIDTELLKDPLLDTVAA